MKKIAICLCKVILNLIYAIMKIGPAKDKVVFLSRQSNSISEDFRMVQEALLEERPDIKIVTICNHLIGQDSRGIVKFGLDTLKSMKHMAHAKCIVLDSYWPAVSLLKHRKGLKVIQMWHAMGKIKKSGYQTLGKESGRDSEIAKLMKMHRGYDYIIAGGEAWNPYYIASFDTTSDKLLNYGLPRIDRLLETKESKKELVLKEYPELNGKKIILYAPTFRRGIKLNWEPLIYSVLNQLDDSYVLVVKAHPNQGLELPQDVDSFRVMLCPKLKSEDFISSAEYLITDYSAIAVEAAVLDIKTLYFLYDFDEYMEKNGMNINIFDEMPGLAFKNANDLIEIIKNNSYKMDILEKYRTKFLPKELGTSTKKITELILGVLNGHF